MLFFRLPVSFSSNRFIIYRIGSGIDGSRYFLCPIAVIYLILNLSFCCFPWCYQFLCFSIIFQVSHRSRCGHRRMIHRQFIFCARCFIKICLCGMDKNLDLSRFLCRNFSGHSIYGCNIRITAFIGNGSLCLNRTCSKLLCTIRTACTAICCDGLFHALYSRITNRKRKGFTICTESLSVFYQDLCILIQVCIRIRVQIAIQIFPGVYFNILCTESLIKMLALGSCSIVAPDF